MPISNQTNTDIQLEIRKYKLKQGFLQKRSKFLKQWRQRWVVLTLNFIYTFKKSKDYSNPTDIINISSITSFKSYMRQHSNNQMDSAGFKVGAEESSFYFKARTTLQKWNWIVAFQRVVDYKLHGASAYNNIQFVRTRGFDSVEQASHYNIALGNNGINRQKKQNNLMKRDQIYPQVKLTRTAMIASSTTKLLQSLAKKQQQKQIYMQQIQQQISITPIVMQVNEKQTLIKQKNIPSQIELKLENSRDIIQNMQKQQKQQIMIQQKTQQQSQLIKLIHQNPTKLQKIQNQLQQQQLIKKISLKIKQDQIKKQQNNSSNKKQIQQEDDDEFIINKEGDYMINLINKKNNSVIKKQEQEQIYQKKKKISFNQAANLNTNFGRFSQKNQNIDISARNVSQLKSIFQRKISVQSNSSISSPLPLSSPPRTPTKIINDNQKKQDNKKIFINSRRSKLVQNLFDQFQNIHQNYYFQIVLEFLVDLAGQQSQISCFSERVIYECKTHNFRKIFAEGFLQNYTQGLIIQDQKSNYIRKQDVKIIRMLNFLIKIHYQVPDLFNQTQLDQLKNGLWKILDILTKSQYLNYLNQKLIKKILKCILILIKNNQNTENYKNLKILQKIEKQKNQEINVLYKKIKQYLNNTY